MIPKGVRRKRARLWAALYVGLFGTTEPAASENDEKGSDEQDRTKDDP